MYQPKTLNLTELNTLPDNLFWETHGSHGRSGAQILRLFHCAQTSQQVALVRCQPGSHAQTHIHEGHESFLVLEGRFEDESGSYGRGELVVYSPGSQHSWRSPEGALIYAVWGGKVKSAESSLSPAANAEALVQQDCYDFRHIV